MPEHSYYKMMAARIVDAFTDITMGQIVDRCKPTKDGKFRPWLNLYHENTKKQVEFYEFNLLGGCGGRI